MTLLRHICVWTVQQLVNVTSVTLAADMWHGDWQFCWASFRWLDWMEQLLCCILVYFCYWKQLNNYFLSTKYWNCWPLSIKCLLVAYKHTFIISWNNKCFGRNYRLLFENLVMFGVQVSEEYFWRKFHIFPGLCYNTH